MNKQTLPYRLSCFLWVSLFFAAMFFSGEARAEDEITWIELDTNYTTIRYQSPKDLDHFDKKIDYTPTSSTFGLRLLFSNKGEKDQYAKLKEKIDALYRRVQEILGMRKKMDRVKINIYQNKEQLKDAFYDIYKREGKFRAWYIFELNTIYITLEDLHEGMLAHEMAHSIIDHYLSVRPPSASAEILARYVDSHLHD